MSAITWGKFKKHVEEELRRKGVEDPDVVEIHYIDMLGWDDFGSTVVGLSKIGDREMLAVAG